MSNYRAKFPTLSAVLLAVLLILSPHPAQALTEKDWMVALVDSLGRSFGLPDEPNSEDYLNILSGKRNLRFEAEAVRAGADRVSILAFRNFGAFSGTGWLLGTSQPSKVHLRFVLPLGGHYLLSLTVGRAGHAIQVGEQHFTADGDERSFRKVEVGKLNLMAGPQEIVVTLPPGGALDCIDLTAANLPAIAPEGGWRPDSPLSWKTLVLTALQALGLEKELPRSDRSLSVEAEILTDIGGARVVEDAHLGQPSGGRWLRTVMQPAQVRVPLDILQSGFYDLELTVLGENLEVQIAGQQQISVAGQPYLTTVNIPPVFLAKGAHHLEVNLPPGGGFDRVVLKARQSDLTAMAAVLGLAVSGDAPTSADLDRLTARIVNITR
jgi:hypothetical protein